MAGDDLSGALLASSITVISLTTVFIGTRLWIRSSLKTIGTDDYLITAAWAFLTGLCTCTILSAKVGFGKHMNEVSNQDLQKFLRYTTGCSATFSIGIGCAKSSFAVLYLRINPQPVLRILNKCLIVFLAMQAIEEALIVILQCRPVMAAYVVPRPAHAKCLDLRVLWWCTFVFNMCTDLFLFIQPIPAMWRLHLPVAKRLDEFAEPMIWSQVELASLVVCSTIPCLRQVIQKVPWLNHALGLSSGRRSSNNYYGWSGSKKTGGSIPLKSYNQNHKDGYLQSKSKGNTAYGLTSHAIGGAHTKNDSMEEIFPYKTDGNGAILVTHEMTRDIESHTSSAAPSIAHVDDCEIGDNKGT
ncbi:hypothetical protein BFJ68_g3780 [Fusarium oxysporum]|uniref:Rhodopsin domain-containing protein n=1 Tax=Fusarium oxysporum TaxID=5507 RepID=A0A420RP23_FUSOX|nr:hypothetical protein BFJ68_g3780 [Fusarium oxysporum]